MELIVDGRDDARWTAILAHGAGQPMDSPFMQAFARGLAACDSVDGGVRCLRFEFPYMAAARLGAKRKPPDREPVLLQSWHDAITAAERRGGVRARTVIGGKSLGGRIASMIADDEEVAGLVCLGYPFHPPGRPERLRTSHLRELRTPALICQGERDPFGGRSEVAGYGLPHGIRLHWVADGDHGFKPRRASGRTETQNRDAALAAIVAFLGELSA